MAKFLFGFPVANIGNAAVFPEDVVYEIIDGSDRACALVTASQVERLLELALRSVLKGPVSAVDEILKISGPLGTFSAKINMGLALNMVTAEAHRDLHLIRKIRNDFAHRMDVNRFDMAPVRERCLELATPELRIGSMAELHSGKWSRGKAHWGTGKVHFQDDTTEAFADPSSRYIFSCMTIGAILANRIDVKAELPYM